MLLVSLEVINTGGGNFGFIDAKMMMVVEEVEEEEDRRQDATVVRLLMW